jgi:hypothetical protein
MEVKRRKIRDLAQRLHGQVTFEIGVDVGEYQVEAFCVGGVAQQVRHWMEAPGSTVGNRLDYTGVPAPSRVCSDRDELPVRLGRLGCTVLKATGQVI